MTQRQYKRRDRRRTQPRAKTIPVRRALSNKERRASRKVGALEDMPATRGACCDMPRPCSKAACRYNLIVDVGPSGALKVNYAHMDPSDLPETCALDVAEQGPHTMDEIGDVMNLSRERVHQIEVIALRKLKALFPGGQRDWSGVETVGITTGESLAPTGSALAKVRRFFDSRGY